MGSIWSTKCNNIACNIWNNILKKSYGFQQPIFLVVVTKKQMLNLKPLQDATERKLNP